jgi:hypothetical protein
MWSFRLDRLPNCEAKLSQVVLSPEAAITQFAPSLLGADRAEDDQVGVDEKPRRRVRDYI